MLIVNADDFGLNSEIDRGIIETVKRGAVNSVSLVAIGKTIDSACEFARTYPNLDVGIHFTLVGETGIHMKNQPPSYKEFLKGFLLGKIRLPEIAEEMEAQVSLLLAKGIKLQHADSHQHIHLFPGIAKIVVNICRKYNIPRIRIVNEPFSFNSRAIPLAIMKVFSWRLQQQCAHSGIDTIDFYGFTTSMAITPEIIQRAQKASQKKKVEIMCHPGYQNDAYPSWKMNWEKERNVVINSLKKEELLHDEARTNNNGNKFNG